MSYELRRPTEAELRDLRVKRFAQSYIAELVAENNRLEAELADEREKCRKLVCERDNAEGSVAELQYQLDKAVTASEADTRRLDWLDKYHDLRITTTTVCGGAMKHIESDGTALYASGGDLRDTIDAAMNAEKQS